MKVYDMKSFAEAIEILQDADPGTKFAVCEDGTKVIQRRTEKLIVNDKIIEEKDKIGVLTSVGMSGSFNLTEMEREWFIFDTVESAKAFCKGISQNSKL